jgi:hypothetical protein
VAANASAAARAVAVAVNGDAAAGAGNVVANKAGAPPRAIAGAPAYVVVAS